LNSPEPQSNEKRPDRPTDTAAHPPTPPELVFKPDARQALRVARVRTFTLLATVAAVVAALILIVSYRPPVVPVQTTAVRALPPAALAESVPATAVAPSPQPYRRPGVAEAARLAAATIDTLVSNAGEKWLRASELMPQGSVTSENGEDVAAKLRRAAILADSARNDIALARQQAEVVLRASREAAPGSTFRLSVLYDAVNRYVKSMADDADDRFNYYAKTEVAVKAVLAGDEAESEIQQNVAMSYLRRSEERQKSIQRQAQQIREALRNIVNADR